LPLPNDASGKRSADKLLAWVLTYGVVLTGLFLIGLSIIGREKKWADWIVAIFQEVGIVIAAATGATLLHEKVLRDETEKRVLSEVDAMLESKVPKVAEIANTTSDAVHERLCKEPPQMTGLRLLHNIRRNSSDYYRWTIERRPQSLFFAGRSILHRIDADVRLKTGGSAEDVLFRCLTEGSRITILFLDPRTAILERLADEEGEPPDSMLGNIAISLGISQRLADRLTTEFPNLPAGAHLTVRIYDRIPYFAYHKQDEQLIVGFYFLSIEGSSSPAYEVVDDKTKKTLEQHFGKIRAESKANILIDFDGARGGFVFNEKLFGDLRLFLKTKLDPNRIDELLNGRTLIHPPSKKGPAGSSAQMPSSAGSEHA
jgi:hypothetical protein